jgi:hypothetical protein
MNPFDGVSIESVRQTLLGELKRIFGNILEADPLTGIAPIDATDEAIWHRRIAWYRDRIGVLPKREYALWKWKLGGIETQLRNPHRRRPKPTRSSGRGKLKLVWSRPDPSP